MVSHPPPTMWQLSRKTICYSTVKKQKEEICCGGWKTKRKNTFDVDLLKVSANRIESREFRVTPRALSPHMLSKILNYNWSLNQFFSQMLPLTSDLADEKWKSILIQLCRCYLGLLLERKYSFSFCVRLEAPRCWEALEEKLINFLKVSSSAFISCWAKTERNATDNVRYGWWKWDINKRFSCCLLPNRLGSRRAAKSMATNRWLWLMENSCIEYQNKQ